MKLWIARDRVICEDREELQSIEHFIERHPTQEHLFGKLQLFYDKPLLINGEWGCARVIAEVESYMYPEVGCEECKAFILEK